MPNLEPRDLTVSLQKVSLQTGGWSHRIYVLEERSLVRHFPDLAEFKSLSRIISICYAWHLSLNIAVLTASKTPGPLSVCQPSMPHLNWLQASKMP